MKRLTYIGLAFAFAIAVTACDPKRKVRQKPAPGPKTEEPTKPGGPTLSPDGPSTTDDGPTGPERGPVDPPVKVPEPPVARTNPEYAIKIENKPGYVKSPYDAAGRMIDVRGLPPGTEAECPYTNRTFLVPP